MALLVLFFAIYCVKNTTQDLIYAITGRVPPSFVREQRRMQFAREALAARANSRPLRQPVTSDRGSRRFFRNAYNDAWETAEERRARWAAKRAKKRHEKWGTEGEPVDAIPAPVTTNARPEEKQDLPAPDGVVHDDDSYIVGSGGKEETLYQRYAMRRRNDGQPMTAVAIADELGATITEAEKLQARWATRYEQETGTGADRPPKHLLDFQKHSRCRGCNGEVTLAKDTERPGQWIVDVAHNREDCPQDVKRLTPREQHDQKVLDLAAQSEQDASTERAFINKSLNDLREDELPMDKTEWVRAGSPDGDTFQDYINNHPNGHRYHGLFAEPAARPGQTEAVTTPNTRENDTVSVNTETTGLQSAIAYTSAMAEKTGEGATSVETSIASLEQGEVGSGVTSHLTQAHEHLTAAKAAFSAANEALTQHINVQEAYSATPDAGNKQFITTE